MPFDIPQPPGCVPATHLFSNPPDNVEKFKGLSPLPDEEIEAQRAR